MSSHSSERAQIVAEEIRDLGGDASVAVADLMDPKQIASMVEDIVLEHGRVDHVVASGAGGSPAGLKFRLFHEIDPDDLAAGKPAAWQGVCQGTMSPTAAMVTQKLKVKGKQTVLLRHMKSFSYPRRHLSRDRGVTMCGHRPGRAWATSRRSSRS